MSSGAKPRTLSESFLTAKSDGTVPQHLKELLVGMFGPIPDMAGFAQSIQKRMFLTEWYLRQKANEPTKWEAQTVYETTVEDGACSFITVWESMVSSEFTYKI